MPMRPRFSYMATPNYSEIIDEYSPNGAIKRPRRYGKTTYIGETQSRIHTHPSGTNNGKHWSSGPSNTDVQNATSVSYVIPMFNKTVYIYDNRGILSSMSIDVYKNFGK